MSYIDYPIVVDPDQITAGMIADWMARGYAADETDPAVALFESIGPRHAETRQVMVSFARAVYRDHGIKIFGILPETELAATLTATWTATDTLGHDIPAGTRAAYPVTGDTSIAFAVVEDAEIPAGQSTVEVTMQAVIGGVGGNGLPAAALQPIDTFAWLASVASTTTSSGGRDAETDSAFLDRLVTDIRHSSTGGLVLPPDYANAARKVDGVHRALAVAGYDPDTDTHDNERTVHVVPIDDQGAACPSEVTDTVQTALEAKREVNFIVTVGPPDLNAVTVAYTAAVADGYDTDEVRTTTDAALAAHLDPARWGTRTDRHVEWEPDDTIRYFKLVQLIESSPGVDRLVTLTLNGSQADIVMDGVAPLPDATIDGTVI